MCTVECGMCQPPTRRRNCCKLATSHIYHSLKVLRSSAHNPSHSSLHITPSYLYMRGRSACRSSSNTSTPLSSMAGSTALAALLELLLLALLAAACCDCCCECDCCCPPATLLPLLRQLLGTSQLLLRAADDGGCCCCLCACGAMASTTEDHSSTLREWSDASIWVHVIDTTESGAQATT